MAAATDFDEFEREALSHLPALMAMARRLTRNQPEAEDLVQETLLKAIRARRHYQPGTHLKAWLFKILRNSFINRYHRGQLERSVVTGTVLDPIADGWIGAASLRTLRDGDATLLRPELRERLTEALDAIPAEFRMVVVLADVEELSYREIAEVLECPIGTVMSRLHRGRKLLRGHLIEMARDRGLLAPEAFIGARPEEPVTAPAPEPSQPVDIGSYREGRSRQTKAK